MADLYGTASQESAVSSYLSAASPAPSTGFSHSLGGPLIATAFTNGYHWELQSCRLRAGRSWSCFGADLACLCPVHVSGWGGLTCSQPALVSATSSWPYWHHTKLHHNFIFIFFWGGGDLKEKKKTFSKGAKTFITTCNSNTFRCCISLFFFLWYVFVMAVLFHDLFWLWFIGFFDLFNLISLRWEEFNLQVMAVWRSGDVKCTGKLYICH